MSWYLDDFPALAYTGEQEGMSDTDGVLRRWKDIFDYAYHNEPNSVYTLTLHPQIIGQAHHMIMFEKLIEHIKSHEGVWFTSLEEVAKCWQDDDADRQKMQLPKLGAGESMPERYGWGKK